MPIGSADFSDCPAVALYWADLSPNASECYFRRVIERVLCKLRDVFFFIVRFWLPAVLQSRGTAWWFLRVFRFGRCGMEHSIGTRNSTCWTSSSFLLMHFTIFTVVLSFKYWFIWIRDASLPCIACLYWLRVLIACIIYTCPSLGRLLCSNSCSSCSLQAFGRWWSSLLRTPSERSARWDHTRDRPSLMPICLLWTYMP